MIAISANDDEIEINGSIDELHQIKLAIHVLLGSSGRAVLISALAHDPAPYAQAVLELVIERSDGLTLVSSTDERITVSGADESLSRFSSWFEFPSGVGSGYHQHFEPLPDDPDHSSDSIPLVVSVKQAGA